MLDVGCNDLRVGTMPAYVEQEAMKLDEARPETPEPGRRIDDQVLDQAVRMVVERLDPDQVILFGSAATGRMTPESDIDLLVLRPCGADDDEYRQWRWELAGTDAIVDVVVMERERAERGRRLAGDVRQAALEDGRSVYSRSSEGIARTGPRYTLQDGKMTKDRRYAPDHYARYLEQAAAKTFRMRNDPDMVERCEAIHGKMELTLKALMIASGNVVKHGHGLNALWTAFEYSSRTKIPIERDKRALEELTGYAGEYRYDPPDPAGAEKTYEDLADTADSLHKYAADECPRLAEEARRRLNAGEGGDEQPVA